MKLADLVEISISFIFIVVFFLLRVIIELVLIIPGMFIGWASDMIIGRTKVPLREAFDKRQSGRNFAMSIVLWAVTIGVIRFMSHQGLSAGPLN